MKVESGEIRKVREFKEKPDRDTAEKYLKAGNYLWNAGIFVWNVKTITESITTYKPLLAAQMDQIVNSQLSAFSSQLNSVFPKCEKISIDFAVMEPAAADGKVYTHPADFGWSDLGNWASLYDKLQHDANGNGSVGNVHFYECHDCMVHADEATKVVLQGLAKRTVIVMGSEGSGMRSLVRAKCDHIVSIPMSGHIDSLNVSVAAGILMYEFRRNNPVG